MTVTSDPNTKPRIHRAWWVAVVTFLALVSTAAFRSSTGALFQPIEETFGWSRSVTSGAVTLNLVVFGLVAPFAAAVMERFGVRRVGALALLLVGTGSGLTALMTQEWHLWVLWGGFIGTGTGAMALVFGAIVANRWFVKHRGLVVGLFSAGNATGQLVFLPFIAKLIEDGSWRAAALVVTVLAFALIPIFLAVMREHPKDVGLAPYGARPDDEPRRMPTAVPGAATSNEATRKQSPAVVAVRELRLGVRNRIFWALVFSFAICGFSTNGLIQNHFIPVGHDHGMSTQTSANLLALIGIFDLIGTLASGWLTDRVDPRKLLFVYYSLRGLSLMLLPSLLAATVEPPLFFFVVFYGLDWVATVPPTVALCREHFGIERAGIVFGWVFAAHMIGAGIASSIAGWIRETLGDYQMAFLISGIACFLAALVMGVIPKVTGRGPARVPRVRDGEVGAARE